MKPRINPTVRLLLATVLGTAIIVGGVSKLTFEPLLSQAHAQPKLAPQPNSVEQAQLDTQTVSERMPDQAHAMADVGYHFANLWFAADKQNWPLANYYFGETRSHLRWAVRIHPVRKTKAGADVDLNGILDAVDNSFLSAVGKAIENKDTAAFKTAYRQTMEGCYACHKASEKPFLRPQIPNASSVTVLNFDPAATWPE
jgi:hypothetical protein